MTRWLLLIFWVLAGGFVVIVDVDFGGYGLVVWCDLVWVVFGEGVFFWGWWC